MTMRTRTRERETSTNDVDQIKRIDSEISQAKQHLYGPGVSPTKFEWEREGRYTAPVKRFGAIPYLRCITSQILAVRTNPNEKRSSNTTWTDTHTQKQLTIVLNLKCTFCGRKKKEKTAKTVVLSWRLEPVWWIIWQIKRQVHNSELDYID